MIARKPAVLLTSSNALSNGWTGYSSHAPPPCQRRHRRPRNTRSFASVNRDDPLRPLDPFPWPESPDPHQPPTPYQIFSQERDEPYSKRRFYELVKLYHPDRHKHVQGSEEASSLARDVMLERYRLVIAANSILSDPLKRDAYDRYGSGWNYHTVADLYPSGTPRHKYSTYHRWRTDGSAAYQWPTDQDPMYNATWEDWERWYRQQYHQYHKHHGSSSSSSSSSRWSSSYFSSGRPRNPLYASNHAFISAVFILAALGGVGQATRAQETNRWRLERTQVMNDRASESLMQARQDTLERKGGGESKDKRIKRFLSTHDGYEEGEFDARALRQGQDDGLCASGAVTDREQPKFWQKPPGK